ncbi:hypothetical protein [Tropicimonas sp. IMCC6043]|uniref:hypothetical protein n=1 Tax=Tropicimonas sp. IMCC6043 TaxID=2510645 RepID=UPI00101CA0F4|nr:hypothetical protein [Tropicimonas sp. IMCC6043]RYH11345.1 hypothetical protein EU800_05650 [Tropicimonas sp. IMCC6043]
MASCGEVLRRADDALKLSIAAWTFGYIAGKGERPAQVDLSASIRLLEQMFDDCRADEALSFLALAEKRLPDALHSLPVGGPGTEAEATALLERFLDPNADLIALTAALKPTPADVSAVYAEPLASLLIEQYERQYSPKAQFGPKQGQNAVLVVYTTTTELRSRAPVLGEFPGGYKDVLDFMKDGHPIVRFKFVEQGQTTGLASDGLIFVNDRWVFMPKPWRALE